MFASKTPRDLNHDPYPWRHVPNYVQHNEPNPILVAFREGGDVTFPDSWIAASWAATAFGGYSEWEDPRSYFHVFTTASEQQNTHARGVLMRLAALQAVTS